MTSEVELYKEKVKVFDLHGKILGMQDKTEFYNEIREEHKNTGKVTRQLHTIRLFILNKSGGIYFTKRSRLKKENTLLYDKTIGAHLRGDESVEYTVTRECSEELGFAAAMLQDEEFASALNETDLGIIGVFKKIETINAFQANYKYKEGGNAIFPQVTTIVIGVYDGPIKFKDGETSGIEIFYPDEILEELQKYPDKYTEDVKILLPKYLPAMTEIIKLIPKD